MLMTSIEKRIDHALDVFERERSRQTVGRRDAARDACFMALRDLAAHESTSPSGQDMSHLPMPINAAELAEAAIVETCRRHGLDRRDYLMPKARMVRAWGHAAALASGMSQRHAAMTFGVKMPTMCAAIKDLPDEDLDDARAWGRENLKPVLPGDAQ